MSVLGIDFGTTNTVVMKAERGNDPVPVYLDQNSEGLASAWFASSVETSGEINWFFGQKAINKGIRNPGQFVTDVKRNLLQREPITLLQKPVRYARLAVDFLKHVVTTSLEQASDVRHVVITAPAKFSPHHRGAIKKAAREALDKCGLEEATLDLLSEPTAAAIAYSSHLGTGEKFLVFDWGGGTLDISVLAATKDPGSELGLQELAIEGEEALGGRDLDALVQDLFKRQAESDLAARIEDLPPDSAGELSAAIRRHAKEAKEHCATEEFVERYVALPGRDFDLVLNLQQKEFDQVAAPLVAKAVACAEKALAAAGLQNRDLSRVLLVGGSSRIRTLPERLRGALDLECDVYRDINPSHAIAYGAAMYGRSQADDEGERKIVTKAIVGSDIGLLHRVGLRMVFKSFLKRSTPLPTSAEHLFSIPDDRRTLTVPIRLADRDGEPQNRTRHLATLILTADATSRIQKVNVRFHLDEESLLHVSAEDAEGGPLGEIACEVE